MYTMVLLIYLQSGLSVNLAGATVSGEFKTLALCQKAAVRKRGPLPVPQGYAAAWQDTTCVPINRDVRVGNERETAFEQLLHEALEPDGRPFDPPCRRPDMPRRAPRGP
ncbi:MAG: hypothetical protein JWR40_4414 [Massilia sp.]|nr:hypothetical protein [Massilia sp.]